MFSTPGSSPGLLLLIDDRAEVVAATVEILLHHLLALCCYLAQARLFALLVVSLAPETLFSGKRLCVQPGLRPAVHRRVISSCARWQAGAFRLPLRQCLSVCWALGPTDLRAEAWQWKKKGSPSHITSSSALRTWLTSPLRLRPRRGANVLLEGSSNA